MNSLDRDYSLSGKKPLHKEDLQEYQQCFLMQDWTSFLTSFKDF